MNVLEDMVLICANMIQSAMENEAEMWKRIMIDAGSTIGTKTTVMNAGTKTAQR